VAKAPVAVKCYWQQDQATRWRQKYIGGEDSRNSNSSNGIFNREFTLMNANKPKKRHFTTDGHGWTRMKEKPEDLYYYASKCSPLAQIVVAYL